MMGRISKIAQTMLRGVSPELAHEAALVALEAGMFARPAAHDDPVLQSNIFDLRFANPIAIAAGFDKDARVFEAVLKLGCGFAEVGSITPRAQPGNPRPRVFRLTRDRAIINRLGFNNGGHASALARLKRGAARGIIGINLGANKDSADRTADYVAGLDAFYDVAGYFMVNISSPNTPGLRDLQAPGALDDLLGRLFRARSSHVARGSGEKPIIVKIAPDIARDDIAPIVGRLVAHGVDGIAVSNTTLARPGLSGGGHAGEAGGLSGRPLFHRSTVMLARIYVETEGKIPLIGIGGVDSGARAIEKIEAGASLIQLYTGLIFEGIGLIGDIKAVLTRWCVKEGVVNYQELVGTKAVQWSAKSLEG